MLWPRNYEAPWMNMLFLQPSCVPCPGRMKNVKSNCGVYLSTTVLNDLVIDLCSDGDLTRKIVLATVKEFPVLYFRQVFQRHKLKILSYKNHDRILACFKQTRIYTQTLYFFFFFVNFSRGDWGERSCPRSATAIHSVAVNRTHNLPTGRRTLYHWATTRTETSH